MQRIPALDGVRAIAILAVLAHHALPKYAPGGFLGVDLFFVLSGFLITSLLAEEYAKTEDISLKHFYMRRALRILPPLPLAIALAILLKQATLGAAVPVLLFFANFVIDPRSLGGLMHTWSLAVEEHFYFLWPAAFLFCMGQRRRVLAYVILVAIGCRILLLTISGDLMDVQRFTPTRMDSIAVGCLAALLMERSAWVSSSAAHLALIGVLACFLLVPIDNFWTQSVGYTLFAALCAVAIAGAAGIKILAHPALQYIGQRSYGLYLYHLPIFMFSDRFFVQGDLASYALARVGAVTATFAIAEASYRFIERPALRHRPTAQPQPSAATE